MKLTFAILAMVFSSAPALADGFVCSSERDHLTVKVYNHTKPEMGTRKGAVMVFSDTRVSQGRKTIAKFTDANRTLKSRSSAYLATVDHRFNDSGRKGELIAGTKIGFLKYILLDLDFSFGRPVPKGTKLRGDLTLMKRNGDKIELVMNCIRYLKN